MSAINLNSEDEIRALLKTKPNLKVSFKTLNEAVGVGNPKVVTLLLEQNQKRQVRFSPDEWKKLIMTAVTSTETNDKVGLLITILKYTDDKDLSNFNDPDFNLVVNNQIEAYLLDVIGQEATLPKILLWIYEKQYLSLNQVAEAYSVSERYKEKKSPEELAQEA